MIKVRKVTASQYAIESLAYGFSRQLGDVYAASGNGSGWVFNAWVGSIPVASVDTMAGAIRGIQEFHSLTNYAEAPDREVPGENEGL